MFTRVTFLASKSDIEHSLLEVCPLNPCSRSGSAWEEPSVAQLHWAHWQQSTTGNHGLRHESLPSLAFLLAWTCLSSPVSQQDWEGRKLCWQRFPGPPASRKSYWHKYTKCHQEVKTQGKKPDHPEVGDQRTLPRKLTELSCTTLSKGVKWYWW